MSENYKVLLDTNFFIRFFTGDNTSQQQVCIDLLTQIQLGKIKPYVSSIILLECTFVLTKIYQVPQVTLQPMVQAILALRNLTILETTDTHLALYWHWETGVKFTDCLIATQLKPNMILCTYDQEFKKLPEINSQTPTEILQIYFPHQ